jgi:hypothetical protein
VNAENGLLDRKQRALAKRGHAVALAHFVRLPSEVEGVARFAGKHQVEGLAVIFIAGIPPSCAPQRSENPLLRLGVEGEELAMPYGTAATIRNLIAPLNGPVGFQLEKEIEFSVIQLLSSCASACPTKNGNALSRRWKAAILLPGGGFVHSASRSSGTQMLTPSRASASAFARTAFGST